MLITLQDLLCPFLFMLTPILFMQLWQGTVGQGRIFGLIIARASDGPNKSFNFCSSVSGINISE